MCSRPALTGRATLAVPHNIAVDVDGVKVWYFQSQLARRLYFAPPLAGMLRSHVHEFAVVHTHAIYLWPLWIAARSAQAAGVPYVVSPRGMLERELIENKSLLWKAALIGFFEKRTLENAAAIHVTSRREADEARAFGFDLPQMCEIPNGVDLESNACRAGVAGDRCDHVAPLRPVPRPHQLEEGTGSLDSRPRARAAGQTGHRRQRRGGLSADPRTAGARPLALPLESCSPVPLPDRTMVPSETGATPGAAVVLGELR